LAAGTFVEVNWRYLAVFGGTIAKLAERVVIHFFPSEPSEMSKKKTDFAGF
jgi:hypothetical protein